MKIFGNVETSGGEIVDTKMQNYDALPSFSVGNDEGRIIYVTTGANLGYWLGREDGSNSFRKLNLSTTLAEYDVVNQSILDAATHQETLQAPVLAVEKGLLVKAVLTSSDLVSGKVLVEVFNDSARSDRFYSMQFDLAAPVTDTFPAFFEVDNSAGDLYVSITNMTGSNGTFSLTLTAAGLLLVQTAPPPGDGSGVNSGVAGDGIQYNAVLAQLEVDLDADPGLQLLGSAGSRQLSVLPAASGGLSKDATGLMVDATVLRTTGAQLAIAGNKTFSDGAGWTPAGSPGAPVAGTFARGSFYVDSEDDVFYCTVGGTPGTWIFWGWRLTKDGGALDGTSYTGAVGPGASSNLIIALKGRRGVLRVARVWGSDSAFGTGDVDVPFSLASFSDENFEGRDEFWRQNGQIRKTIITGVVTAGTAVIPVTTVNVAEPGDLARLRNTGIEEEYGRITVRQTGPVQYTVDENVVNAYAANDIFMLVTEFGQLPWINTSSVPANFANLYLQFRNEDDTETLDFGYEFFIEELGGTSNL